MKKQTKNILSWVMSAAMVVTLGAGYTPVSAAAVKADNTVKAEASASTVSPGATTSSGSTTSGDPTEAPTTEAPSESAKETVAGIVYADGQATYQWDATAGSGTAVVNGDGDYSVRLYKEDLDTDDGVAMPEEINGVAVFTVDVKNLLSLTGKGADEITADVTSVKLDGQELEVDTSMINKGSESADYRIELHNEWGGMSTSGAIQDKADFVWSNYIEVNFSLSGTGWGAKTESQNNPYYGFVGFSQDGSWVYRNGFEDIESTDYNLTKQLYDSTNSKVVNGVAISDAKITEDGAYTASVSRLDGIFSADKEFKSLYLATNIPTSMKDVKFSDVTLKVDGEVVKEFTDAADIEKLLNDDQMAKENGGLYVLQFWNFWNKDDQNLDEAITNVAKSIEVTFTVEGIDYTQASDLSAKYEARKLEPAVAPSEETAAPSETTSAAPTTENPNSTASVAPTGTPNSTASVAPTGTPNSTASVAPTGTPTDGSTTSESALKTKSVTAAKKKLYIAAGKSTTLKYTIKKAAGASDIQKVKVTSSSTKLVKVSNVKNSSAKLTAPKSATKGKTATITIKSGSKSVKVKVTVKNPVKKVKAAKKKASVKAKKTVKLKFKLTNANKKANTTDSIKVTSSKKKVAKVTKKVSKKGTLTVTVKGVKKGSSKITVKVGKKKAVTTVKVK